VIEHNH